LTVAPEEVDELVELAATAEPVEILATEANELDWAPTCSATVWVGVAVEMSVLVEVTVESPVEDELVGELV